MRTGAADGSQNLNSDPAAKANFLSVTMGLHAPWELVAGESQGGG